MFADLFGSYSIALTKAVIPSFTLLKSTKRYFLFTPPPWCLTVILPWLLRPVLLLFVTTKLFSGVAFVISALVKAEMVASRGEGRRAIEQGGVTADGEKITDVKAVLTEAQLKEGVLLKKGKKSFKKVVLV